MSLLVTMTKPARRAGCVAKSPTLDCYLGFPLSPRRQPRLAGSGRCVRGAIMYRTTLADLVWRDRGVRCAIRRVGRRFQRFGGMQHRAIAARGLLVPRRVADPRMQARGSSSFFYFGGRGLT